MPSQPAAARRASIVDLAVSAGLTSVDELSERFGVTPSTIRRDLALLTRAGQIARTYGGAMPAAAESSLRQRRGEAHAAKAAIARWASAQVRPGQTVILDAGSTVGALAGQLREVRELTVATISMTAIGELADADGVTVECLGGRLRPLSDGFVGALAEAALERITADAVFLGTDGVSLDGEICEADLEQTRLKELMIRRADRVYVLAHGAKLGSRPFHAWLQPRHPWTLVTDVSASDTAVDALRGHGVDVVVAA